MGVEQLDQLGKVGERAGQPVDLIDNDHVDSASANIVEQLLERRPIYRAAGVAAVVVVGPDQLPAFMSLALDVGFRCLPLIVERVELLLQAMFGRDAGVDCAAAPFCLSPISWQGRLPVRSSGESGSAVFDRC